MSSLSRLGFHRLFKGLMFLKHTGSVEDCGLYLYFLHSQYNREIPLCRMVIFGFDDANTVCIPSRFQALSNCNHRETSFLL